MGEHVGGLAGMPFDRVWFVGGDHVGGLFVAWCHKFPGLVFRGFSLPEAVLLLRRYNVLNG